MKSNTVLYVILGVVLLMAVAAGGFLYTQWRAARDNGFPTTEQFDRAQQDLPPGPGQKQKPGQKPESMAAQIDVVRVTALESNLVRDYTSEPVAEYDTKLHRGSLVQYQGEQDGWFKVQLRNGQTGWLPPWEAVRDTADYGSLSDVPDISGASEDSPVFAKVISEVALVRNTPTNTLPSRSDHSRLGMFARDTIVKIIGSKGHWCKIALDGDITGWIYDELLEFTNIAHPGRAKIQSISSRNQQNGRAVTVSLDRRVPFTLHSSGRSVTLKIHNATVADDVSDSLSLPADVDVTRKDSGVVTITQNLDHAPFGYDALYQGTGLVFTVADPPAGSGLSGLVVVLDPGHGSETDPIGFREGARANGLKEEEINMDVARLAQSMIRDAGGTVILTRDGPSDEMNDIYKRIDFAQKQGADIFVSIHANTSSDPGDKGLEVFWYDSQSKPLAQAIVKRAPEVMGTGDGKVMFASFGVIRQTEMPSVVVEMGYLTNEEEAKLFTQGSFLAKCAQGIVRGITEYASSVR